MSITVAIQHKTDYLYDRPVALSPHLVRLRPAPHTRTPVHRYSLKVEPSQHFVNWFQDPFGNYTARLVFPEKTDRLSVTVDLVAEMTVINPFDFFVEEYADNWPFAYEGQLRKELLPYFEITERGPLLNAWLAGHRREKTAIVSFLVDINRQLRQDIGYIVRLEPGIQSCEETLKLRTGSCRDSAWLLVQILRHMGLAARFVSGYLVQLVADVKSLDGPSGPVQDFTDLHAWAEVYVPGAGWLGLDATSGLFAGEGHIPLACTPDPVSAAPVTGAVEKSHVTLHFENRVQRFHEDPRVTKPYTEEQWAEIMALGRSIDEGLTEHDVRLTMGGEPTFVSIDDMDGAEWNTAALGPHKRERAEALLDRLKDRFARDGVLHYAQGKWYPGEPLPRWALSCFWRSDGEPLWKNAALLAGTGSDILRDETHARAFIQALARRLGLDPAAPVPGFEDGLYYLWKEGTLPGNVTAEDSRLRDPLERTRLRRLFKRGLDRVVGYALPLAWDEVKARWKSTRWAFRREDMFLIPGDSPMGLRLPLDALPWEPEEQRQKIFDRDPFADRESLPPYATADAVPVQAVQEQPAGERGQVVHTALCVEPREGRLHVFLPPLSGLEEWVALVKTIETVAQECSTPVVLEGYEPPRDPRLNSLKVTPDPGVIEVNVHPTGNWEDLTRLTEILYEDARLSRLGTEKFMLDGRHTGTGGGNHVTLGGPTPADSPLLRRPSLLASLVTYWQNHPALSYLFSGLFVGPTSQAPRVDEARDDALFELGIAMHELSRLDAPLPWIVDRVFRNLLVDLTGNTHRAEFCIDKLYSPDSSAGRQGIVEFRGFDMPPHWRMSCAQMLLLRGLVCRFWNEPYPTRLVRWGTELHDRFMLPHFVQSDFLDVIDDLNRWGMTFDPAWFDPFFEFRFPRYGTVNIGDVEIELRGAIEPWHVLGEEATGQGTSRFVDSSAERIQVRVNGIIPGRHAVACNGKAVPLRNTGRRGEYVAGVRFKAWQPPSGLHPTIPAHAPLVFDLVDIWNSCSVGGCTYHVAHPSGRNYETFPVNANEAEARRRARFWDHGHTPGPMEVLDPPASREHPYTLDLRFSPREAGRP